MKRLLLQLTLLTLAISAQAQDVIPATPGTYVDEQNQYFQQANLPVYFYVGTSPQNTSGTALAPQKEGTPLNAEVSAMKLDGHGKHFIRHHDAGKNEDVYFVINADALAPKTRSAFSGAPKYTRADGTIYYGKGLNVEISAADEMSGVKQTYVSRNQQSYQGYSSILSFSEEGQQVLKYYSTDKVGNTETVESKNFLVDISAPTSFHHVTGITQNNVISTSTKIYLTIEDNLAGVKETFYQFDDGPEKPYNGTLVTFNHLEDGNHTLTYYSVDHVNNVETKKSFSFYLDKTAPIVASDVLGDRFIADDKTVYFSGRTKLKLTAVDNKSGVKEVRYSVDGTEFAAYDQPFYLPSVPGVHVVKFYALDEMDNQSKGQETDARFEEYRHNVSEVYVDLTGPSLSSLYKGPAVQVLDRVFISGETQIIFKGTDPESGMQYISYSLDGQGAENRYEGPISIKASGAHSIDYFGYDNVNNRNKKTIEFLVDNDPPSVITTFSIDPVAEESGTKVYPAFVNIYLSATDKLVGADQIYYSLNGSKEAAYRGPLSGLKKNTDYTLIIKAKDQLGNEVTETITFKTTN